MYSFSYNNYRELLRLIKSCGTLMDYRDVGKDCAAFILLRHDVEFTPERALRLAKIEAEEGVQSTYFFQLTNNAYNLCSAKTKERLRVIREEYCHNVGLHFHLNGLDDIHQIENRLRYELDWMSNELGYFVDRFSFHRPSKLVLENPIQISGVINAYDPKYFVYSPSPESLPNDSIKYIADSRNSWSYTAPFDAPCEELFQQYPRLQILCHPYSWTDVGYDIADNLRSLLAENRTELIDTICNETNYAKEYRDEL